MLLASQKNTLRLKPNKVEQVQSPGFPNTPYPSNSFTQWQLRADYGQVIKLQFDTINLEENCTNDAVKIYDSLVAMESRVMGEWVRVLFNFFVICLLAVAIRLLLLGVHLYYSDKSVSKVSFICVFCRLCGHFAPNDPQTFMTSGNVMLVTMATNEEMNYPGFRAQVSQIPKTSKDYR